MKELFLNNSLTFLKKYKDYTDEEIERLSYGLEGLYLTLTKLVIIVFLALLLGIFKSVFLIIILFNIIRYFGFGVHAGKSSDCLISSILLFIIIPYLFISYTIPKNVFVILGVIEIISYILFAPADTIKRPFFNAKKRKLRKLATILIGILYLVISLMIDKYKIAILFQIALLMQSIVICPITYMLLGQPYNNYKKGKRVE